MSSFKESVDHIMEDMKGRFRNPLILSFILVWLYYHWPIIYKLLTINNAIPVDSRLSVFTAYVKEQTQLKMLWYPLIYSFVSLAGFYLIGVAAQVIKLWLGKRLSAEMLAKYDTGKFEEKSVVEKIRKEKDTLKTAKESLETELDNAKSKIKQKEAELEETNTKNSERIGTKDTQIGTLTADLNKELELKKELQELYDSAIAAHNQLKAEYDKTKVELVEAQNEVKVNDEYITGLEEKAQLSIRFKLDAQDIFGVSVWNMTWSKNGKNHSETFTLERHYENYAFKTTKHTIILDDFLVDGNNNTISFRKTNLELNYKDVPTVLIIQDANRLSGIEGNDLLVNYQRQGKQKL